MKLTLDEIISESKTIKSMIKYSSIGDSVTKVMRYKSNYLGQTEEITYPDGEKIEYSYNEAGQVDGIKGNFEYVKNIGYNKHAQRNHIEYGNGVVSDYTYSNTRRWLTELKTKNSGGAAATITVAGTVVLGGVGIYSLAERGK